MAKCRAKSKARAKAEQQAIPVYYSSPSQSDGSDEEYLPLVVRAPAPRWLATRWPRTRELRMQKKEAMPRREYYRIVAAEHDKLTKMILTLNKEIFKSEDTRRTLERLNHRFTMDNEFKRAKIDLLMRILNAHNKDLIRQVRDLGPEYGMIEGLDSSLESKEDLIHRIKEAHMRLKADYRRKNSLHMLTNSEVQTLLTRNKNLLMSAYDFLRHAKWSLHGMPSAIDDIEISNIPREDLSKIIGEADIEISHYQLLLRIATQKHLGMTTKVKTEEKDLEKSKFDLEIFSEDVECIKRVALVEKNMKGIINLILKAREMVEDCYQSIEKQEKNLRARSEAHNRELRKAYLNASQRQDRPRSVGEYPLTVRRHPAVRGRPAISDYSMRGVVLCELPTQGDQADAMENMLPEAFIQEPALSEEIVAGAIIGEPALDEDLDAERRIFRRQTALSGHLERQMLGRNQRANTGLTQSALRGSHDEGFIQQPAIVEGACAAPTFEEEVAAGKRILRPQLALSGHLERQMLGRHQRDSGSGLAQSTLRGSQDEGFMQQPAIADGACAAPTFEEEVAAGKRILRPQMAWSGHLERQMLGRHQRASGSGLAQSTRRRIPDEGFIQQPEIAEGACAAPTFEEEVAAGKRILRPQMALSGHLERQMLGRHQRASGSGLAQSTLRGSLDEGFFQQPAIADGACAAPTFEEEVAAGIRILRPQMALSGHLERQMLGRHQRASDSGFAQSAIRGSLDEGFMQQPAIADGACAAPTFEEEVAAGIRILRPQMALSGHLERQMLGRHQRASDSGLAQSAIRGYLDEGFFQLPEIAEGACAAPTFEEEVAAERRLLRPQIALSSHLERQMLGRNAGLTQSTIRGSLDEGFYQQPAIAEGACAEPTFEEEVEAEKRILRPHIALSGHFDRQMLGRHQRVTGASLAQSRIRLSREEAFIQGPALAEEMSAESILRRQSAISDHLERQRRARSQRDYDTPLATSLSGLEIEGRRSLEGVRGRVTSARGLAQSMPAGLSQSAAAELLGRPSQGQRQRRASSCERDPGATSEESFTRKKTQ